MAKREEKVKEHSKGLLKGALFGTIVGGIAALLLAP
jgi:gas vesicle protein